MTDIRRPKTRPDAWAILLFAVSCGFAALSVYLISTTHGM